MFDIRYKDINPDTGEVSTDRLVCTCPDEMIADWVYSALVRDMSLDFDEPNREFYIRRTRCKDHPHANTYTSMSGNLCCIKCFSVIS